MCMDKAELAVGEEEKGEGSAPAILPASVGARGIMSTQYVANLEGKTHC